MFEKIKHFISEHPYLIGGLTLVVVVYFLIRNSGGSSSTVVAGGVDPNVQAADIAAQAQQAAGSQALQAQTQSLGAGLQALQIQTAPQMAAVNAGLQLGLAQTSATQESTDAQTAAGVAVQQLQSGSAVQIALAQAGAGVQENSSNNATTLGVSTIQAQVVNNQTAAELAAQQDIDATSLGITGLQVYGATTINGQNTSSATSIAQTNAATQQDYINTTGTVDLAQIEAAFGLGTQSLDNQSTALNDTMALETAGTFNKGGEGGLNQITAWLATFNSSATGQAASAAGNVGVAQNSGGNTPGGIISALGGLSANLTLAAAGIPPILGSTSGSTPSVTSTFTPGAPVDNTPNPVANLSEQAPGVLAQIFG